MENTHKVEEESTPVVEESTPEVEPSTPVEDEAPKPQEEPAPDYEALIAEAEQRGYLRGRNERIEELMAEPAPFARQNASSRKAAPIPEEFASSEPLILNNPRVSIWDR